MHDILNEIKKTMRDELETSNAETFEQAEYFDNFDAEDFEQMDNAEYAEYLDFLDNLEDAEKRKGIHNKKGHRVLHKRKKNMRHSKGTLRGRAKLSAIGAGGSYHGKNPVSEKAPVYASAAYIHEVMIRSVGDLNITVTRRTAAIAQPLPYILFDLNGFQSNYVSTLKPFLPAGVTVLSSVDTNGDVLLTYTDGVGTDIVAITLSGSQISYSEFLQNMNQNFFKSMYIRQEYPNTATLLTQVSQAITFGLLSALGMNNKNTMLPRSRRLSSDYQSYIVNLFIPEQSITADFSFVQNIINTAGTTIAWDVFMSERINLNLMQKK